MIIVSLPEPLASLTLLKRTDSEKAVIRCLATNTYPPKLGTVVGIASTDKKVSRMIPRVFDENGTLYYYDRVNSPRMYDKKKLCGEPRYLLLGSVKIVGSKSPYEKFKNKPDDKKFIKGQQEFQIIKDEDYVWYFGSPETSRETCPICRAYTKEYECWCCNNKRKRKTILLGDGFGAKIVETKGPGFDSFTVVDYGYKIVMSDEDRQELEELNKKPEKRSSEPIPVFSKSAWKPLTKEQKRERRAKAKRVEKFRKQRKQKNMVQ